MNFETVNYVLLRQFHEVSGFLNNKVDILTVKIKALIKLFARPISILFQGDEH